MLDPDLCYRALRTRDTRFDGRFFTGVRSTGIYCRPVCPARTPRRENCVFLPCAAAAQEAGFRPCLRCRPEAAPGTPAWTGTSASVARALRLIDAGALDSGSVGELAERVGLGERQLRRLFLAHLGAAPQAVAHSRRLLFALGLIDQTALPMTQVAFTAGFASVRRFNAAVREATGRSPRELRGAGRRAHPAAPLELHLAYRPPLDWEALMRFLAPRAIPGVECVEPHRYRRTLALGETHGVLGVEPVAGANQLRVSLALEGAVPLARIAEGVRRIFDLGADPAAIAETLKDDPRLAPRLRALPGVRVPGAWDGFELATRVVLGQQVSVAAATRLAGRLVRSYGEPLRLAEQDPKLAWVFPSPESLSDADPAVLRIPRARAGALRALADAVAKGDVALHPGADPDPAALCALPGIGPWTAAVIAMRALQEPDAFPSGDLGIRRALGVRGKPTSEARVERLAERWRPWRAYAAMLLWSVEA